MTIRLATMQDRFAMVRMGKAFLAASGLPLPSDPAHMEATAKAHIAGGDRAAWVLEADGGVHGMLLAIVGPSPLAPVRVADEVCWWIDPPWRGQGAAMLDVYEAWAVEQGATVAAMHAPDDRVARLYARRGYARGDVMMWREIA